jgi:hypothetical protein
MALFQALFSMLSRSLGKVLNAIFGWAVVALFGQTTPAEKTLLSGLVGLAAAWPVLLIGVAVPRIAGLILALVPPSAQGPSWLMRIIWIGLVLAVPITLGLVMAAKAPPGAPREPLIKRALRGFPITVGLAAAFLLTFATVPFLRIASAVRRWKDEHVPLVTQADAYDEVAQRIDAVLAAQDIDADRSPPPWWMTAPTRVLLRLGGKAFRGFVPQALAYWRGPRLEIALYPSDLLLRGARRSSAFTHGVLVEDLVRSAALQTFDPAAQEIERQIRRVWRIYDENPGAHRRSVALLRRLRDLTDALGEVDVPYEEWSILYRQCGQLSRAIEGQPPLLARERDLEVQAHAWTPAPAVAGVGNVATPKLMTKTARAAAELIQSELALARSELRDDLASELTAAKGLSVALVCAILILNLLLLAGALALAAVMPAWLGALTVGAAVAAGGGIAGAIGWKHVKPPLVRTRKSLQEDARWLEERMT